MRSADFFMNQHKAKVYAYTIERGSPSNPTPVHPPYSEMQKIIQEITAPFSDFVCRKLIDLASTNWPRWLGLAAH
jgi:hypothetical protein